MYELLRRLSEPTLTVPVPRLKHIRRDSRPWQKRVASGFLHAGRLLAGFFVAGMAMEGLSWWSSAPINSSALLAFLNGWFYIPIAATIMLFTAHRWAPSIVFFFVPGLRNASLTVAIGGSNPDSPIDWLRTPRLEAIELATCFALVVILTWRFLTRAARPDHTYRPMCVNLFCHCRSRTIHRYLSLSSPAVTLPHNSTVRRLESHIVFDVRSNTNQLTSSLTLEKLRLRNVAISLQ